MWSRSKSFFKENAIGKCSLQTGKTGSDQEDGEGEDREIREYSR